MKVSEISHEHVVAYAAERVNLPRDEATKTSRSGKTGLEIGWRRRLPTIPSYGLVKSLHAGSVAKGTALRTVNDLDSPVYVQASEAPSTDAELVKMDR